MSSSHFFHPQCTASLETGHNVLNTKRFDALATTQGIRAPDRLDFLTSGASQIFKRLRPLCLSTRRVVDHLALDVASRQTAITSARPSPQRYCPWPPRGTGGARNLIKAQLGPPAGHQHPSQGRTPCCSRRPARAGSLPLGGYYTTEEITDAITAALGNYFTEVTANLVNAYTDTQLLNYSDAAAMNQAIADADRGRCPSP